MKRNQSRYNGYYNNKRIKFQQSNYGVVGSRNNSLEEANLQNADLRSLLNFICPTPKLHLYPNPSYFADKLDFFDTDFDVYAQAKLHPGKKFKNLTRNIVRHYYSSRQDEATFRKKFSTWKYIYAILASNINERFDLYMVGSTVNGFGMRNSDLDLSIFPKTPKVILCAYADKKKNNNNDNSRSA